MNRHRINCGAAFPALVAFAVMMLGLVFAPQRVHAQNDDNCVCDSITINIDPAVRCRVTICLSTPDGIRCITLAPGTRQRVPCIPGAVLSIRDCHGNLVPIGLNSGCRRGIGAGPHCCTVDACPSPDAACTIDITPSILDNCPCP